MITQTMEIGLCGAVFAVVGAGWWLANWLARRRIVRWLHGKGCEVRILKRAQVGRVDWDSRQLCYFVEYSTPDGATRRKLCITSRRRLEDQGIFWREITENDLLPGDWQCFECRARIPKGSTVCPKCGWS